jgi:hypothetical protein
MVLGLLMNYPLVGQFFGPESSIVVSLSLAILLKSQPLFSFQDIFFKKKKKSFKIAQLLDYG